MRVVYGIHGYGRGHATRALALLPSLRRRHDVHLFAGGDAFEALRENYSVERLPHLGYVYRKNRISPLATIKANLPLMLDCIRVGPRLRRMMQAMRDLEAEVVLCDCEPLTARAADLLSIPRISLDHFGIMDRCKVDLPWIDRLKSFVDRAMYRALFGGARHALVSSFYHAAPKSSDVRVVGTLLRDQVRAVRASRGTHLIAYFNRGRAQYTPGIAKVLGSAGCEVRLYGAEREGREGDIVFRTPSDQGFLEDLASARAVIGTAGNQLVGEAIHFGKPLLVMAENSVEQRMNAAAIARLGIGKAIRARQFSVQLLHAFLQRIDAYALEAHRHRRDGRDETLALLEDCFADVAGARRPADTAGEVSA